MIDTFLTDKPVPNTLAAYVQYAVNHSPFFKQLLTKNNELCADLSANYQLAFTASDMHAFLATQTINDTPSLKRALRLLRQAVMARIILRDLNGLADLNEVMLTTSFLAEVCIKTAIQWIESSLTAQYGQPSASESDPLIPQSLMVIGMGKLGGYELNVSSDIDLIFAYESAGETNGMTVISNQEYFTKVSQQLILAIDDVTADGFVFRVDMRLRPFGSEGALVCSLSALEHYYQAYGREWERYAWIKGRVVNGDGQLIRALLKPFVFRRYLDFGALENMRALKAQIEQDVNRRALHDNIKLGRGGIREIEFIAQVFQLMRGGQEPALQVRPTLEALRHLAQLGLITDEDKEVLANAYVFLRNLEHRLQYYNDAQTHDLPKSEIHQNIIASVMGFASWHDLLTKLVTIRDDVASQFDEVFSNHYGEQKSQQGAVDGWSGRLGEAGTKACLTKLGYAHADDAYRHIQAFKASHRVKQLPDVSKLRLDDLMPIIIELSVQHPQAEVTLQRMINLIETICRRASYLAFFAEFPHILDRLTSMVSASPWIASYLSQHPILLDSFSKKQHADVVDNATLETQILEKMQWLDGDVEQQMNVLREFQQMQLFTLASNDVIEHMPVQLLSDKLSALADIILRVVLKTVWPTIKGKHCETPKFAIIAYGKHGGYELGYASDLDMVFLYQDDHPEAREIYSRFGMRIISWLNTMTSSGILYETDMQLRPNGNSGLLVSSVEGFKEYQLTKAWVWEHQAITRARFAVGDAAIGAAFEQIRRDVLVMPRAANDLKVQVKSMREKMKATYHYKYGQFDLKKGLGGMIDIEFIVQYLVLAHAKQYPELMANVGNIKILYLCGTYGLIPEALAKSTSEAYIELRKQVHAKRLQGIIDPSVPEATMQLVVETVRALWQYVFIDN